MSVPHQDVSTDALSVSPSTEDMGVVAQFRRLLKGDSGLAPIVVGLLVLVVYFQARNSVFLSANNLTNLSIQATVFVLLGMAEIWVLLLGEIDLSVGVVAGLSGAIGTILVDTQYHWSWFFALPFAVLVTTAIGAFYGLLVVRLRLPSFIVTLAGYLGFQGVLIYLIDHQGTGGSVGIQEKVLYDLVGGSLTPVATWLFIVLAIAFLAFLMVRKSRLRRANGLEATSWLLTGTKVAALAVVGLVLVMVFNTNRSSFIQEQGMPFAIPIDFAVLAVGTFILNKTKAGRYIYGIGGNTEATRRGGVNVGRYRLLAFMCTGFTTGIAGLLYASRLGGMTDSVDSTLTLYAVASAVIGGTSLFGGRGKMIDAVVGGLVIATIYNGMALIGMSPPTQYIATAIVMIVAVTIDSVARRGSTVIR